MTTLVQLPEVMDLKTEETGITMCTFHLFIYSFIHSFIHSSIHLKFHKPGKSSERKFGYYLHRHGIMLNFFTVCNQFYYIYWAGGKLNSLTLWMCKTYIVHVILPLKCDKLQVHVIL